MLLPLNVITENLYHIREDGSNQRLIISAKTPHPLAWKVSKIENTKPIGIIKMTMEQDAFSANTDYIEKDGDGYVVGMWADYWKTSVEPIDTDTTLASNISCELSSNTRTITDGGSYKTITAKFYSGEEDVSSDYTSVEHTWTYQIDGEDVSDYVAESLQDDNNKIKIKFKTQDRKYLGKVLTIGCAANNAVGTLQLQVNA